MAFVVTTTGTMAVVVLNDLGGRSLTHPVVSLDLEIEFSSAELAGSANVQSAISAGYITVVDGNGEPVTDAASAVSIPTAGQAEAEAGIGIDRRIFTPLRVAQAIAALAPGATPPPDASETVKGVIEIATQAEANAGSDDLRSLTPLKLGAHPRLPTQGENDALVGSSGAPSSTNKYVTNDDPRFAFPTSVRVKRAKLGEDWAVATPALPVDDPLSGPPQSVFRFDDTVEEGIGYESAQRVPVNASKLTIHLLAAAFTTPGVASNAGLKIYAKSFGDNAARQAAGIGWGVGLVLSDVVLPTNRNWQYFTQTVTLAALGISPGDWVRLELTRIAPTVGPGLTGDLEVREESLTMRFS